VAEIIPALGGGKPGQARADRRPELLHGAPPRGAEQRFEFRKPEFNRIEVRTVRWQVPEVRAGRFDALADALDVMGPEVIHHDDVPSLQRRRQDLIEIGEERVAVHRSVEEAGRGQALHAQGRDEGAGLPMMVRRVIMDARAATAPTVAPEQVSRDAAFIKKHEPSGINRGGEASPVGSGHDDVGAILLGRAHRFF
jgi:hypothetical protein